MSTKKKKQKTMHLHVMIPSSMHDRLTKAANIKGTQVSSLIRILINEYLDELDKTLDK